MVEPLRALLVVLFHEGALAPIELSGDLSRVKRLNSEVDTHKGYPRRWDGEDISSDYLALMILSFRLFFTSSMILETALSLLIVALGVLFGVPFGVPAGVPFGVPFGVPLGVLLGVTLGFDLPNRVMEPWSDSSVAALDLGVAIDTFDKFYIHIFGCVKNSRSR